MIKVFIGTALIVFGLSLQAHAATRTWTGLGGDNKWSTADNWDSGAPVSGDDLVFEGETQLENKNDLDAYTTIKSITFNSTSNFWVNSSIGGSNPITLGNFMGSGITNSAAGAPFFGPDMKLGNWTTVTNNGGWLTMQGALDTQGYALSVTGSGAVTISGGISGTGNVGKSSGSGTLALSGSNTYTGYTGVYQGTLKLNQSGVIANTSSVVVSRVGTCLLLDNDVTNVSNRINDSAAISLGGGTFSLLGSSSADTTETIGAVTLAFNEPGGGYSTINVTSGTDHYAELTAASLARGNGEDVVLYFTGAGLGTSGNNPRVKFTSAPDLTNGIIPYATVNGTDFATYDVTLGIKAATPDKTTIDSAGATDNVRISASEAITAADKTVNSLIVDGGYTVSGDKKLTIGSGALMNNGTAAISVPTLAFGAAIGTIFANDNITVSSAITGDSGIVKAGTGNLTISGANTYSGKTSVYQGTLTLGAADRIPDGSSVCVPTNAVFDLNGNNETIGSLDSVDADGSGSAPGYVKLGAGSLTTGGDNTNTVFLGVISGDGVLTKTGSGTFTLVGTNTFTGGTVISAGTLATSFWNSNVLPDTGTVAINGGTFSIGNSAETVGAITINGGLLSGAATVGTCA